MSEPKDSVTELWKWGPFRCVLIGDPDCPILKRWVMRLPLVTVRLHHFYPNTSDRDTHDHPWWFLTFVLQGGYDDIHLNGKVDRLRRGSIRFRSAHHAHRTYAGADGCWTLIISQKAVRPWGFFPSGKWMPWQKYMQKFGHGMVCDD